MPSRSPDAAIGHVSRSESSPSAAYVAVRWPAAHRLQHDWGHLERDKQEALYAQMREQIMASIRDALAVVGFEVVEEVEASV